MFINKLNKEPNLDSEMSFINLVLKTELTCIPRLLGGLFGDHYDNTVCNGATWMFGLWCTLHFFFDKFIDTFLKRLRYRDYVRTRLKSSLWYLGFYGTCLAYCCATFYVNELRNCDLKSLGTNLAAKVLGAQFSTPTVLGYIVLSTFYLHSTVWEGLARASLVNMLNYLLLFVFMVSSHISGALETIGMPLKLAALISAAQFGLEFIRCCFMSSVQTSLTSKIAVTSLYVVSFVLYFVVCVILIPLTCILPVGMSIMTDNPSIPLLFQFLILVGWLGSEIYRSVLLRFMNHWLYHEKKAEKLDSCINSSTNNLNKIVACRDTLFECSLFEVRDDLSYHLQIVRNEIEERKSKMMALRKPKNVFFQTLKCMVAIKRKLSERRLSESNAADELIESEQSLFGSENLSVDPDETPSDTSNESEMKDVGKTEEDDKPLQEEEKHNKINTEAVFLEPEIPKLTIEGDFVSTVSTQSSNEPAPNDEIDKNDGNRN